MADPAAPSGATPDSDATSGADTTSTTTQEPDTPQETGEGGKRAIDALRRELRESNKRIRDFEEAERARADAERTDLDRATSRAEEAERRVGELEHEALQRQVAIEAEIADAWSRLRGSTREELEADAKDFVERYGTQAQQQQQSVPRPDFGAGARPTTPATGREGFNETIRRQRRR
jgi:hypothetical protein